MNKTLNLIGRTKELFTEDISNNNNELEKIVSNSTFLVLGGAGSIGQAVTKEIFKRNPKKLHVVDISENNMVELVREYKAVNNPHRDFINDLSKEKSALNDAFEAVRKTTPGTKERAAAINVVNEQYGQYLPKLLTEKSSLEEIATAQNAATNALIVVNCFQIVSLT